MLDPFLTKMNAEIRYQELLKEAEAERRYQKIKGNNANLWQRIGDALIAAGQTLKAQASSKTTTPSLDPK